MARLPARGLSLLLVLLTACAAPAQPKPAAPAKPAPAEPAKAEPIRASVPRPAQVWPFTRFRGVDYVAVRDIAKRYGLKAAWTKRGEVMTLSDARGVRLTLERDERDFHLDGARVFLGELAYLSGDSLTHPGRTMRQLWPSSACSAVMRRTTRNP